MINTIMIIIIGCRWFACRQHHAGTVALIVDDFFVDLLGFLYGDVLAINQLDLLVIGLGGAIVLLVLKLIWRSLFAATVSPEIAR